MVRAEQSPDDQIAYGRQRLDQLDGDIVRLIKERVSFSELVQSARVAAGGCRTDSQREQMVITRYGEGLGPGGSEIALQLLRLCRVAGPVSVGRASRVTVRRAFLGPAQSVSQQAAELLGDRADGDLVPLDTFEAVMRALVARDVDEAVLPLENCASGQVTEGLAALAVTDEVCMVGQLWLPVAWVLAAAPGTVMAQIVRVGSHPHALAQTRAWRASLLSGKGSVVTPSTSAAAQALLTPDAAFEAVVCTRRAAEHYRLHILAAADTAQAPRTRFALVQTGRREWAPTGNDMTSLVLTVRHVHLSEVLGNLARSQIEVLGLHALPAARARCLLWLDCRGHAADRQMIRALSVLREPCEHLRVVGTYPAAPIHHPAKI